MKTSIFFENVDTFLVIVYDMQCLSKMAFNLVLHLP